MSVEGRLTIDLERAPDGSGLAHIASSRPLGITRALVGAPADDVVKTIPLLFNVCGAAQGAAAAQACERALGIGSSPETHQVRRLLVLVETLREHLVRAVADWTRFVGLEPQPDSMLHVMRLCTMAKRELDPDSEAFTIGAERSLPRDVIRPMLAEAAHVVEELVFGEPLESWGERQTLADLDEWCVEGLTAAQHLVRTVLNNGWADAGRAAVDFLPELPEGDLGTHLFGSRNASFVAAPIWAGLPRETSVLSRQVENRLVQDVMRVHGTGLLARLAARLVEIGEIPRAMADIVEADSFEPHPLGDLPRGRGIAHVEAARGRLVHGVHIADEVVSQYAILAPTEWNFHVAGGAQRGLAEIAGRDGDVRSLAALFVSSIDPCVGFEVRVH